MIKTRRSATAKAKALRKLMKSKGWKLRVSENLGWHYAIEKGPVYIFPTFKGKFMCLISSDANRAGAGLGMWTTHFSSKDPNETVQVELKSARAELNKLTLAVIAAEECRE